MHNLRDIIGDTKLRNPYDDATLLLNYQAAGGDPDQVIYLSLGETWSRTAPGLRAALASGVPDHCHGYILSPYGLPELHSILRTYITASHDLADAATLGEDYEVAVSQNSTRNAMFHFGRHLIEERKRQEGKAIAIASSPGWDYSGVLAPLGYIMRNFTVTSEEQYQPDPVMVEALLRQARQETTGPVLLIINAQHNPTGANWDPGSVRTMIRAALDLDACLLVDDAYYAVHNPDVTPTNTLRILLEEINASPRARRPRWLAVRSLGKQFHCNGWGIGALTAAPDTITHLLAEVLPRYTYVSAVPLQAALAGWLRTPASDHYLDQQRVEYAAKRAEIAHRLTRDLGYPETAFFPGQCAAYLLMRIPPWYGNTPHSSVSNYRHYCLTRAGVLLGEGHMTTPGHSLNVSQGCVRLYLGPSQSVITEALNRMAAAGLTWRPGPDSFPPAPSAI